MNTLIEIFLGACELAVAITVFWVMWTMAHPLFAVCISAAYLLASYLEYSEEEDYR